MNRLNHYIKALFLRFFKIGLIQILLFKSFVNSIKAALHPDKIFVKNDYLGQKTVMIALYEKGELRNDIKRLLSIAKNQGYYVLGVNTLKLSETFPIHDFFDCYIERYNFGRDFGSYKTGFMYLFSKGYEKICPRLLMINDSVFYESTRTPKFIQNLMNSEIEVLGATENHEINYHLGSFCIAMGGNILNLPLFKKYWLDYKNSDLRPLVIKKGEIALTGLLKKLVTSSRNFSALYDVVFVAKALEDDPVTITNAMNNARSKGTIPWHTMDPVASWNEFLQDYYNIQACLPRRKMMPARDFFAMQNYFTETCNILDPKLLSNMTKFISAKILEVFSSGSQIHQNNPFLLNLGLPLIKLDGYYRGVFLDGDILTLASYLEDQEKAELMQLLYAKSFGVKTMKGLERIYYKFGYI